MGIFRTPVLVNHFEEIRLKSYERRSTHNCGDEDDARYRNFFTGSLAHRKILLMARLSHLLS